MRGIFYGQEAGIRIFYYGPYPLRTEYISEPYYVGRNCEDEIFGCDFISIYEVNPDYFVEFIRLSSDPLPTILEATCKDINSGVRPTIPDTDIPPIRYGTQQM